MKASASKTLKKAKKSRSVDPKELESLDRVYFLYDSAAGWGFTNRSDFFHAEVQQKNGIAETVVRLEARDNWYGMSRSLRSNRGIPDLMIKKMEYFCIMFKNTGDECTFFDLYRCHTKPPRDAPCGESVIFVKMEDGRIVKATVRSQGIYDLFEFETNKVAMSIGKFRDLVCGTCVK